MIVTCNTGILAKYHVTDSIITCITQQTTVHLPMSCKVPLYFE